jgi:hypothetical protein
VTERNVRSGSARRLTSWRPCIVAAAAVVLSLAPAVPRVSSSAAATTASASYVAMGDSYAAGEGLPARGSRPWLSTSGTPTARQDGCDRSARSYPMLVARGEHLASSFGFVACSGARTGSGEDPSSFDAHTGSLLLGKGGEGSQLDALSSSTRIVTLTVGGDDIGFSTVLKACLGWRVRIGRFSVVYGASIFAPAGHCATDIAEADRLAAPAAQPSPLERALIDTYTKILQRAPTATLYVLNYPQLFAPRATPGFCALAGPTRLGRSVSVAIGVTDATLRQFNALEVDLNTSISYAAAAVNASTDGAPVTVVDVNALTRSQALLCSRPSSAHPIVNGLVVNARATIASLYDACFSSSRVGAPHCSQLTAALARSVISRSSFHPTAAGQALMAGAVESALGP